MKAQIPVADYFDHQFALEPRCSDIPVTSASDDFARSQRRESASGVKFDPEKSGAGGLGPLASFAGVCVSAPVTA